MHTSLRLLFLLILAALAPAHAAAPTGGDLLKGHWSGGCDTKDNHTTAKFTASPLALAVENLNDNKIETYPHLSFEAGGQDWRPFQTLKLRMRLTSSNPDIVTGGKNIGFFFSDGKYLNEINGGSREQTRWVRLSGGDWQDVTVDLRGLHRANINGFDIHFYVAPYGITHDFKIEVAQCDLVKEKGIIFDGKGMSAAIAGGGSSPSERLSTPGGLVLALGMDGGVAEATVGEKSIVNGTAPGGILVRDHATDAPPVQVQGSLETDKDGAVVQSGDVAGVGVHVDGKYTVEGELIHVNMKVSNPTKETRYLTLYFAVPLKKTAWTWHDDIVVSYPVGNQPIDDVTVKNPVAALTSSDAGIALGLDLTQPRVSRLAYNETNGLFYAAFDVTLMDGQAADGHSLNEAECNVYLLPCDPQWGLRSALQTYYAAFPQWFANRLKQNGGWELGRDRKGASDEQVMASGCRIDWEVGDPTRAKWNTEHGILNTAYIEPEYVQMSLVDLKPSYSAAMERVKLIAANDEAEWQKFSVLEYTHRDGRETQVRMAKAILASGQVGLEGAIDLSLGYRTGWIGGNGLSVMVPCNLDPGIPDGRGRLAIDLLEAKAKGMAQAGAQIDGWGLDSFEFNDGWDYGVEHFRNASFPVTFNPDVNQPAQFMRLACAAFARALHDETAAEGKILFGNLVGTYTYAAPYLDVFGTEAPIVADPPYARTLAYHRTVNFLPYTPKPDGELAYNFLYGAYPGRGLGQEQYAPIIPILDQLNAAGWEPVTYAQVSTAGVRIERFGSGDHCYLVFYNPTAQAASFRVTVNAEALKGEYQHANVLFGPSKGQPMTLSNNGFSYHLDPRQTAVIQLE